ncbi:hypothetical protein QFZ37_000388 [Chryseobacterium ginsenosidimutans]|uniref:hypothetical protein n=1 Tax=Chryseobacterium ginsenosidimutans TaxID=687846 RepID=UPI0027806ECC|nr:hypothetical protein [Chryseobacterium ginsenosidimutans]MDQ0592019.1 hypothetical protein [Chryseobacterium ginsenosidimutans]
MPKLNEYLGGLVSEIVSARKMADLQTVQVAKEYANDDLLKHFSVPRMKIGNIELTVPFAQSGASVKMSFKDFVYDQIITTAKEDYDLSDKASDQKLKDFLIPLEMDYNKIVLTKEALVYSEEKRARALEFASERLSVPSVRTGYFDDLSKKIVVLCESLQNFKWNKIDSDTLFLSIRNRIIKEYKNDTSENTSQNNEVIVEALQLMKIDPKYLIYAKVNITETGMEWCRSEDINGDPVETLIPE